MEWALAVASLGKMATRGPWALLNWRRRSDSTSRYVEGDASRKAAQCGGSILGQDCYGYGEAEVKVPGGILEKK